MNNLKKILALILAILTVFLVACGAEGAYEETSGVLSDTAAESESESSEATDTEKVEAKVKYYITGGSGKDISSIQKATEKIGAEIEIATGVKCSLHNEKSGGRVYPEPAGDSEIFVGVSEREAYAAVGNGLQYGEWRIKSVDGAIVIVAPDITATLDAVEYFIKNFVTGKKTVDVPADYEYTHDITSYPVSSLKLGGIDLSEYSLVYKLGSKMAIQAANDLAYDVGMASGIVLPTVTYSKGMDVSRAIIIGETMDHTPITENYGDSKVYAEGTTVYVDGNDIVGLERGITYLSALFTKVSANVDVALNTLSHTGALQSRAEYLNDATAFVPCYDGRISAPAEKLSFSYKITQLNKVDGEVLVIAHRGEHTYYPENSLEGAISAWRMGVFSTEFDIHMTKDGKWVAMHDETVSRTTNVTEARAADSSLPKSDNISDWTLDQIRTLRLKDDYGVVTPFLIPTLEEGLRACDGRLFLHLDKSFDFETEILPVMVETNVFECVYLCNNIGGDASNIIDHVKETYGKTLYTLTRTNTTSASSAIAQVRTHVNYVKNSNGKIAPAIVFFGDYVKSSETYDIQIRDTFSKNLRVATWVLRDEADYEFVWRKARSYNYSIFLTDHPYEFMNRIK